MGKTAFDDLTGIWSSYDLVDLRDIAERDPRPECRLAARRRLKTLEWVESRTVPEERVNA